MIYTKSMFVIIVFIFSLIGIIVLLSLKHWEQKRGRTFFSVFRFKADVFVIDSKAALRNRLPSESKRLSRQAVHYTIYHLSTVLLQVVQYIEKRLLRFINMIKGRGEIKKGGSVSFYLKNVSEHKNHMKEVEPPSSAI